MKSDSMAYKKSSNGNGVTLGKVFELIENSNAKNEIAHSEIKVEVQKNRTEVLEKMSDVKERLVRIESQPAHENFQKNFCPNTKTIEEIRETGTRGLREYIELHRMDHNKLNESVDKVLDSIDENRKLSDLRIDKLVTMYEKKVDEANQRFIRTLRAAFIAILAIAIPAIIDIVINWG